MPGGSCAMVYVPLSELTAVRRSPVPVFVASTWTPATCAPDGSRTVPLIEPVTVCARRQMAEENKAKRRQHSLRNCIRFSPLLKLVIVICPLDDRVKTFFTPR